MTPDLEHVRTHCPCGKPVALEWHEKRDGLMDGHGQAKNLIERFLAPLYFHDETRRWFCSARCSLFWHQYAWHPFQQHLGRAA